MHFINNPCAQSKQYNFITDSLNKMDFSTTGFRFLCLLSSFLSSGREIGEVKSVLFNEELH